MVMNFSRIRSRSIFAALLALGGLLLAFPQRVTAGFADGMTLCLTSLLPALFPFFVVCNLAVSMVWVPRVLHPLSRFVGFSSADAPALLLLSWLGGYAVCAQTVARFRQSGRMGPRDSMLALVLGCCSGPGFVIGCIGGSLLGSVQTGVLLYLLQLAANFLAAALLLPWLPAPSPKTTSAIAVPDSRSDLGLSAAISGAVDSCLCVCGCVIFFRILYHLVLPLLPRIGWLRALASGCLEISAGCADFAALGVSWAVTGLCLCLSGLSLSVFAQIHTLLQGSVPLWPLALSRLLHLFWLQGLFRLCAHFLPGVQQAYSSLSGQVIPMTRIQPDAAAVCFCFLCAVLYKVRKNFYNKI